MHEAAWRRVSGTTASILRSKRCASSLVVRSSSTTHRHPRMPAATSRLCLRALLGSVGKDVRIEAPFHFPYGFNISLADKVFPQRRLRDPRHRTRHNRRAHHVRTRRPNLMRRTPPRSDLAPRQGLEVAKSVDNRRRRLDRRRRNRPCRHDVSAQATIVGAGAVVTHDVETGALRLRATLRARSANSAFAENQRAARTALRSGPPR